MVFKYNLVKYCFVSMLRNVYAAPYSIYSSIMLEYFLLVKLTERWGYNHTVLSRVYRKARQHDGCLTDMFHKLQTPNLVVQLRWWNIHRQHIVNREVNVHSGVQVSNYSKANIIISLFLFQKMPNFIIIFSCTSWLSLCVIIYLAFLS